MFDAPPDELPDWIKTAARHCAEPLKTARELRPLIEAHATEAERLGYVPDAVMRPLCETGVFGLKVPRKFGGTECDARTYIDVIEELSYADGSTGWVVMAGNFSGGGGVGLGPSAIETIYGGQEGLVSAAQISSLGRADVVDGGLQVSGNFHFGSSSRYASWFGGAFVVHQDGEPVLNDDGRPKIVMCIAPRASIRLKSNWDVFGLTATGSDDFDFPDQFIPEDWIVGLPGREKTAGPIHMIGVSIGHVAWALGVGKRALAEIHALAQRKRRFGRATLIDNPVFQRQYGEQLAVMQAARALVIKVFDDWYEAAQTGQVPLEVRAQARLTSCWATDVALKAAQFAMFSAGSDGVRNRDGDNVLQRAFRDIQTGATHRHIDGNILIEASQILIGVPDPKSEI